MEARQESQVHGCACGCEMYFTANEVDIRLLLQTMSQPQNTTEENLRAEQPEEINAKEMVGLIHQKNDVNNQLPKYDGLEGWVLIEKIGNGATSDVYRAKNIEGTLEVAIKIVRKLDMKFKQEVNIFREVSVMLGLDHPNIVKLIEFSESERYYFLILELLTGGELFQEVVDSTFFSEELSRHVIREVANALYYLHEIKGVVHRDIKLENILFQRTNGIPTRTSKKNSAEDENKAGGSELMTGGEFNGIGRIKIADFGLSKIIWDDRAITPCGTVGNTAPEIVNNEQYSKSIDMWALGCVLYTMLCGFPPFHDRDIQELKEKVVRGQYMFLSPWWDHVSQPAQDLVSHLLMVDPKKRFTIDQFLQHPWVQDTCEPIHAELDTPPLTTMNTESQCQSFSSLPLTKYENLGYHSVERCINFQSPFGTHCCDTFAASHAFRGFQEGIRCDENSNEEYKGMIYIESPSPENDYNGNTLFPKTLLKAEEMRNTQPEESLGNIKLNREFGPPTRDYGQHNAAVLAVARQHIKNLDVHQDFELSLEEATLLKRRRKKLASPNRIRKPNHS